MSHYPCGHPLIPFGMQVEFVQRRSLSLCFRHDPPWEALARSLRTDPTPWTVRRWSMYSRDRFPRQNCFQNCFHLRYPHRHHHGTRAPHAFIGWDGCLIGITRFLWRRTLLAIIVSVWTIFIFVPSKIIIASKYLSTILTVHVCRSGSVQMTKKPVYSLISAKRICRTHRPHIDLTSTPHRPHIDFTSTPHRPHIDLTSTLHRPHIEPTSTPHRPHIDPTSTSHRPHIDPHQKNINVSKHFILGHLWLNIPPVKMPYKHKRDCPVCDKPGLRYMSDHLRQKDMLSSKCTTHRVIKVISLNVEVC